MFNIDLKSRIPIYEQLIEHFKTLIIQGVLEQDEKLPSVRALAQELTINPNTIQKAYRELESQGFIYSQAGVGSFVSGNIVHRNDSKVRELKGSFKKVAEELIFLNVKKEELKEMIENIDVKEVNQDED